MKNNVKYPKSVFDELQFKDEHKRNVLNRIKSQAGQNSVVTKKRTSRKVIFSTVSAAAVLVILIGSANLSLGAAKVAAKIPYFHYFIQQEEYKYAVAELIGDVANDKGYQLGSFDLSIPDKEVKLGLRYSKKDYESIKGHVEKNINKALIANNFGSFDIITKRERVIVPEKEDPKVEKYTKDSQALEQQIIAYLKENHYEMPFPVQARINQFERFVYVAIPKTETRTDELKAFLDNTTALYGGKFKYRISKIDMKAREQELRWEKNNIISILVGGLMTNKEFKVSGFSYSFHPLPLQITIKTSVDSSDEDARSLAKRIEGEINSFIQTDDLTKEVRNDPYEITILSKDKKKIN
ncbi:MAG: DUF4030 domain-containing protein [Bacillus sp. (in: firmicutes)]